MADAIQLDVSTRTDTGKGAARRLRRGGQVPGVIYGHGREAEAVTVDAAVLGKMLTGISAATTIIDVMVDSRPAVKALIRELQRDPVRPAELLHVDLYEVRADEKVTVMVPVHLNGTPDGVRTFGGVLDHPLREVEIEVLPGDIPSHVDLDVSALGIGDSIFVRDLVIEKAEILTDPDTPICTIVAPRVEEAPTIAEEETGAEPELIRKAKAEAEDEAEDKD